MKIEQGKSYIIKESWGYTYRAPFKIYISEITKTSILFINEDVDSKPKIRMSLTKFNSEYKIIEAL